MSEFTKKDVKEFIEEHVTNDLQDKLFDALRAKIVDLLTNKCFEDDEFNEVFFEDFDDALALATVRYDAICENLLRRVDKMVEINVL